MIKASALGQNGTAQPSTSTSRRIKNRTNCAKAANPNTTLATRNPRIWEFMINDLLYLGTIYSIRDFSDNIIISFKQ